MSLPTRCVLATFVLSLGCRPPEAPKDLDQLSSYMFGHVWDDDDTELQAGLSSLRTWLQNNLEETEEGFEVNNLDQEQVDTLDNCKRDVSGLLGAAVATRSDYKVPDMVRVSVDVPAVDVFENVNHSKRLDFEPDKACYLDQECDRLQYRTLTDSDYALNINIRSKNGIQHRWVETEEGMANVYRSWLQKPAIISAEGWHVDTQFYVSATMPWQEGSIRLQATWAATEIEALPVPESMALNLTISTMQKHDKAIAEYLGED